MSNLMEHARLELELAGQRDTAEGQALLEAVGGFASAGWSGGGVGWGIETLARLLRFEPLTGLTSNPAEWMDVAEVMPEGWTADGTPGATPATLYQSRRNPEAFSLDGGATYYLLSEREAVEGTVGTALTGDLITNDGMTPMHETVPFCAYHAGASRLRPEVHICGRPAPSHTIQLLQDGMPGPKVALCDEHVRVYGGVPETIEVEFVDDIDDAPLPPVG